MKVPEVAKRKYQSLNSFGVIESFVVMKTKCETE